MASPCSIGPSRTNEVRIACYIVVIAGFVTCVDLLLKAFVPVTGALGAVHSGWRGTAMGIAAKAVAAMCREFGCDPAGIRAAIGPCIGLCCFEVGPEVPTRVSV